MKGTANIQFCQAYYKIQPQLQLQLRPAKRHEPGIIVPRHFSENAAKRHICKKNCAKQHIWPLYVNLGGDIFWFALFPSVAQLSSVFPYLSCFPNAADMLPLSSSSTSMASSTMTLLTNQRPRKCDKTEM